MNEENILSIFGRSFGMVIATTVFTSVIICICTCSCKKKINEESQEESSQRNDDLGNRTSNTSTDVDFTDGQRQVFAVYSDHQWSFISNTVDLSSEENTISNRSSNVNVSPQEILVNPYSFHSNSVHLPSEEIKESPPIKDLPPSYEEIFGDKKLPSRPSRPSSLESYV